MVLGDHPPSTLMPGKFETALTENIVYPNGCLENSPEKSGATSSKPVMNGFVQAYSIWDAGIGAPQKIERVHKVGNKYLYELKKMLPYDSDY